MIDSSNKTHDLGNSLVTNVYTKKQKATEFRCKNGTQIVKHLLKYHLVFN